MYLLQEIADDVNGAYCHRRESAQNLVFYLPCMLKVGSWN